MFVGEVRESLKKVERGLKWIRRICTWWRNFYGSELRHSARPL